MTLVCLKKTKRETPRTVLTLCQRRACRGGGDWGWGVSFKHWWKEQQRQKSIFGVWMKIPSACKLVVWTRTAAFFFPAVYYCPLSLVGFPHSLCLLWSSLSYRLKTEGIVKRWIACDWKFAIHHMVVHLLHTLSCDLFNCTSLVALCMSASAHMCL